MIIVISSRSVKTKASFTHALRCALRYVALLELAGTCRDSL